jgi:hypothetical protein
MHAEDFIGQIIDCLMPDGFLSVGIISIGYGFPAPVDDEHVFLFK